MIKILKWLSALTIIIAVGLLVWQNNDLKEEVSYLTFVRTTLEEQMGELVQGTDSLLKSQELLFTSMINDNLALTEELWRKDSIIVNFKPDTIRLTSSETGVIWVEKRVIETDSLILRPEYIQGAKGKQFDDGWEL